MPDKLVSIAILLAALCGVSPAGASLVSPKTIEKAGTLSPFDASLSRAYEALAARKLDDARKLFQEAAQIDPVSMIPWLGLADVARAIRDEKGAESALKKAAELAPDRTEPVIAMARLYYARNAYDEAERLLGKASKMDPQSPVPLVDLGDIHAGVRRDPEKAMNYYRQAIELAPRHAGAHYALGMLLLSRDTTSAVSSLETAKKLVGNANPLPSLALGRAYGQLRNWRKARESFNRALTIQPGLAQAYVGRAATYSETGDRVKALSDLRKAEELKPSDPEAPFRIGMLHQKHGAVKEAYEAYERAIRLDPKHILAYNNLAWMAASRRERLDEALDWIQKARALAPKDSLLCDTHGWVLRARGDIEGSMKVLAEGIALNSNETLHYHLGVTQMEAGRKEDARNNLRKALEIKPDFTEARDAKQRLNQLESPSTSAKK